MMSAASTIAKTGPVGMPKAIKGMKPAIAAALLAASAQSDSSMAPFPNFFFLFLSEPPCQ
jgi:hypothetical protein